MSGLTCGLDGCPGEVMADGFCDTCGRQPAKAARFSAITSVASAEGFDDPPCPGCGAARDPDALFCEACGFDFVKGKAPSMPVARPSVTGDISAPSRAPTPPKATSPTSATAAAPSPGDGTDDGSNGGNGGDAVNDESPFVSEQDPTLVSVASVDSGTGEVATGTDGPDLPNTTTTEPPEQVWEAVVETDAVWYARFCETWKTSHGDDCPIPFPGDFNRTQMIGGPVVVIGRHAVGIDLAKNPNDAAVSHRHASLIRQPDGTYALTDLDSSNGTYVDEGPIAKGQTTTIGDGESFTVGAFTRITLNYKGP